MSHDSDNEGTSTGEYFISMTDMMVGVLFVFIIIIAYFVLELQKTIENDDLMPRVEHVRIINIKDTRIDDLEKELERLRLNSWEQYANKAVSARNQMITSTADRLREIGINVDVDLEIGVIRLEGDGLFNSNSSDLSEKPGASDIIESLSSVLEQNISCFGLIKDEGAPEGIRAPYNLEQCNPNKVFIESVYIEGHSDSDAIRGILRDGSRNNLELSARRATNTYDLMEKTSSGLISIANPMGQQVLSVSAYGSQRSIRPNTTSENKSKNRRIDFRFVMYLPDSEESREALTKQIEGIR